MRTDSDQDLQLGKWIASAAVGAIVMYMLDPERGAARRAETASQLRKVGQQAGQAVSGVAQDVAHRAGVADVFHARDVGPSSSGSAFSLQSLGALLDGPATGIKAIARQLRERSWDPKVRNAAMYGGGALGLFSLITRRSPLATVAGLAGAAYLARNGGKLAASGGAARSGSAQQIERSIRIEASPEQVYDLWSRYENFPRFMKNVVEVRDLGGIRSHWVVKGPAGTHYEWDSILTEQSRPDRLAWQSAPGSEIEQYGEVRLEEVRGGTRATVRLSYHPPAGAAGQAIAALVGSDPARQLEEDLQRMKLLLETGTVPDHAAQIGRSDSKFLH
ncbi:MAG: SRPBCC family protein [Gammaproteobacteria bacterium]